MNVQIEESWKERLSGEFEKDSFEGRRWARHNLEFYREAMIFMRSFAMSNAVLAQRGNLGFVAAVEGRQRGDGLQVHGEGP